MPAKKEQISDEERARRLRETAREIEADSTEDAFKRAFDNIIKPARPRTPGSEDSRD